MSRQPDDLDDMPESSLEAKVDALAQQVAEIKGIVGKRFSWEEKATESGIQIAGGPTTVTHFGSLLSMCAVPTPQGVAFALLLKDESTGKFAILSPDLVKPA